MTTPSQARIDAALRLAEADEFHYRNKDNKFAYDAHMAALEAYRATLPKLRSRAEKAEQLLQWAEELRECNRGELCGILPEEARRLWDELLAKPTAPESAPVLCERKDCTIFGPHTHLDINGDPVPTQYVDCGKCRYPTSGTHCEDEWCSNRGCCGHEPTPWSRP